jgi:hypothetical protein
MWVDNGKQTRVTTQVRRFEKFERRGKCLERSWPARFDPGVYSPNLLSSEVITRKEHHMPTSEEIERALEIYEARIESGAAPTPLGQHLVELAQREQTRKETNPTPLAPSNPPQAAELPSFRPKGKA